MKKTIIVISITALFITSCTVLDMLKPVDVTPIPPTPMPTSTPDPCAAENLLAEVTKVQDLVNEFADTAWLCNFTPKTELAMPILQLQKTRRELLKMEVPACEEAIKTASLNFMNNTINSLALYMAAETQEDLDATAAGLQNSDVLWQVVQGEFNKLLTSAGLVSDQLPDTSSALPPATENTILVGNEGAQGVNVRSQPELNAEIVASLEPGMQAIALFRNEAGDWLQVNLNGVIGWVFTEMVTPSSPVEQLTILETEQ